MLLPYKISTEYSGLAVTGEFKHRFCYFNEDSGSGKTFFFKALKCFFNVEGIRYTIIDCNRCTEKIDILIKSCEDCDFILLDNVELYDVKKILRDLHSTNSIVVINHHKYLPIANNGSEYTIHFNKNGIVFRAIEG